VDPDARHAHKTRHRRQDGFKAHVVVEPDTGLITATELTKAAGPDTSDATVGVRLLDADLSRQPASTEPAGPAGSDPAGTGRSADPCGGSADSGVQVLGDSAYGSGEALAGLQAKGHEPIIKPVPLRAAVPGGFTTEDFTVDQTAGTVTCPNSVTRPMDKNRIARFGAACTSCPLRGRCTTSKTGRDIRVHPHDAVHRAHRARAADPTFRATYRRHRPMVERSIAWLTRHNRRVPYRGVAKNNAWLRRRVAALNLRRLLVLGLQRLDDQWVLAQP
jgi:Transposase DDE domain